MTNMELI